VEIAKLVLSYLQTILSAPPVAAAVIVWALVYLKGDLRPLLKRLAKLKTKFGDAEFSPQLEKVASEAELTSGKLPELAPAESAHKQGLLVNLTEAERSVVVAALKSEFSRATLWEYRYLNFFLARHTQQVLDWIASLENGTDLPFYNDTWMPQISNQQERQAVLKALEAHALISIANGIAAVTEKGRDYLRWRGPLAPLPSTRPDQP